MQQSQSELKYLIESLKYSDCISTTVKGFRGIAIVKSKEGFHKHALKDLEQILPLARLGNVRTYHDYLNSLAVELLEAGRIEEASNISRIVLASPYAFAYPEWRETGQEIEVRAYRSRSQVSVDFQPISSNAVQPVSSNLNHLPEREAGPVHAAYWTNVYSFAEQRKKKMAKEGNGEETKLPDDMSGGDIVMEILKRVSQDDVSDEQRLKILDYTIKVLSKK